MPISSKQEDERYLVLKSNKKITCLERQVLFRAVINEIEVFKYTADFAYVEDGVGVIEEYKGYEFDRHDFRLRMKVCSALYPKLLFRIVTGKGLDTQYKAGKIFSKSTLVKKKKGRPKLR